MSCNICEDDYGITFCKCSYTMCNSCAEKHLKSKKKDECPQCKKSLKTLHFFSGKICENTNIDEMCLNRIFVYDDDKEHEPRMLCNKHGLGRTVNGFDKNQIIPFSDFICSDPQKSNFVKIIPAKLDHFNATVGPFVIINPGSESNHGMIDWDGGSNFKDSPIYHIPPGQAFVDSDEEQINKSPFKNIVDISEIVIQRNSQAIQDCDVFTLTVNNNNDCICSLTEWGQALGLDKILILNIDKNNGKLQEYYMCAKQSLLSLQKLSFTKREGIIKNHPKLNFETYKSYEKYMNHIINRKKGVYSKYP